MTLAMLLSTDGDPLPKVGSFGKSMVWELPDEPAHICAKLIRKVPLYSRDLGGGTYDKHERVLFFRERECMFLPEYNRPILIYREDRSIDEASHDRSGKEGA